MNSGGANPESGRGAGGSWGSRTALVAAYVAALAVVSHASAFGQSGGPAIPAEAALEAGEEGRFQPLSWQLLAGFDYAMPDLLEEVSKADLARSRASVPQRVRALDGKQVAIRGYVIPLETQGALITSFVLAATNQIACCFGDSLAMNEWIIVDVPKGQHFESKLFELATVLGSFHVGEDVQDGYVMSLYRMLAQKIRRG